MTELLPPRWPGGPKICPVTMLPAFESRKAATDWHDGPKKTNPLYEANLIVKMGKCKDCGHWHFKTKIRGYG